MSAPGGRESPRQECAGWTCGHARVPGYPQWHQWSGVLGLLYARRPKTSPPMVVRARTPAGLEEQIGKRERALRAA
jgi:hypothetical protein